MPVPNFVHTDDVLIEKAKALAPFLLDSISEDTKSLFEQLKKDKKRKNIDEKFGEVFFEIALFYLHVVDRIAFEHLGAEKRNVFMHELFIEFRETLSRVYKSGIEIAQFRSVFTEVYEERQQEYGKYKKWSLETGEGAKDTLLWEFGEKSLECWVRKWILQSIYMFKVMLYAPQKYWNFRNYLVKNERK